jgi:hypothetical protein
MDKNYQELLAGMVNTGEIDVETVLSMVPENFLKQIYDSVSNYMADNCD